jgi:16S rRNA (cytosine1402-N4)-methyltransferase
MPTECFAHLKLQPGEVFCDCTLGGAGHSLIAAAALEPNGMLIGIDQDDSALKAANERINAAHPHLAFVPLKGNFIDLDELLVEARVPGVDAFLFDLGVSSPQIDNPARGFSYAHDAPLDMRMDPGTHTLTAAEVINTYNAADLTWILRTYGEERWAARIATFAVRARESQRIETTGQLVDLIKAAIPAAARAQGGNPAKRTFQALRICVNGELDALRTGLEAALRWLTPGGRVVVLSYHSLEDRIVKEAFAAGRQGCTCPPDVPVCTCGNVPYLTTAAKKPERASEAEIATNPRAKSARLRWAIKK